ncbi:MAG: efflux RND transporter periplasmic adaptor subunit [Rhodoferax sp.]|uniref:efflux RND transporter periplasmic adaptor subunit n=1 Tax=Rhodoferax sp. TaxID=50421 RepID=UPI0013FFBD95|nr:efflux RND transporter periplasmic adaptor subunit [Rhodoferax sp.]NDP38953.1 efflux RND transporter periplasmic adaptor subunit [Rhodoferax sp.]
MHYLTLVSLTLALTLSACTKSEPAADALASQALLITLEDLFTVHSGALTAGPVITGSIQPQRRADLRAEVSAVVLQVLKDNGDQVRRGELLVRLDDTAIRDSLASADDAVRASSQSFDQAERQMQRLKTLRGSGMATTQQLEDAEIRRNNARSDLSAARTRTAQARQQLERTLARAPFDGVVSERKVSAGDTAQMGKELLKVMDPTSMRFEGLVSADAIGDIKLGQAVHFRVNGYGQQEFTGAVKRINPSANVNTRQVEVQVEFAHGQQPQLSGLYAEGAIEAATKTALMVPAVTLVREGDKTFGWQLKDNTVHRVSLTLGERDPRGGDFVLRAGLAEGDQLIRNPTSTLKDGQKVQLSTGASAPAIGASGVRK